MKIKTRLLLGFGAMLLLMSVLAVVGINRLSHLNEAMDEVYQNRYTKVKLANNIRTNVSTAARSITNLIMNDHAADVAKESDKVNQSLAAAGEDFIELGKISQDPAEKKVISDLTTVGKKYYEYKDQVFKYIASNQVNAAAELRKNQGSVVQTELLRQLDLLVNLHEQAMNNAYTSSTAHNKATIAFLTCLASVGLLIGLGIMLWIISSISNGLDRVVKFLSHFSKGDIDMSSRINVISKDEIGEVAKAFNSMADQIEAKSAQLLMQQNELKDSNNRLQSQTIRLLKSEELLQQQQEELQISNDHLQKKTELLEEQIRQTEQINRQIQKTKSILEQQTEQLASSSKYKSEFLANMSHELRTPLNSMLILSQLLAENKEGNMLPKQVEFAHAIHESGSDLIRLINEILDLSKVEAGKIEIVPEPVQLIDLSENIKRSFIFLAGKKNLSFTIHVDDEVPLNLYTDSYRVEQILNNLLSNAFKFTEHGGVTLSIALADNQEYKKYGMKLPEKVIAFSVTDTGIGIPEDKLGMIFEAFQQENGTTSRKFGGTGLGLSISRELARLLGGKITVISKLGMGSTFTLYLPEIYHERFDGQINAQRHQEASVAQEEMLFPEDILDDRSESSGENRIVFPDSADEVMQVQGSAQETDLLRGKKILIVDDDIRNIFALSSVFEGYHMQVVFAESGQQALDIIEAQADFDLILMDIMMPEMDGYDTIKLLRSNPQFAKLPIIALTAKAMDEDREQCLEAGASDYISKPIHIEQLLSLMYNNLVDGENADGI